MTLLFETPSRSIPITKQMVWDAYRKVKSNKGSAGVDEETLIDFDAHLSKNLYKLWNRLSSGSYFPQPVKAVEIPKGNGGMRTLGIPTIADRIAQEVVKNYIEPRLEAVFVPSSYGYRPHKSAHDAIEQVRTNVRNYGWVIDMDIKSFFDEVDHDLLLKALSKHVTETWVMLYIKRWLASPVSRNGVLEHKVGKGTPQGGVISPLLANLYLHYVLDKWLEKYYPNVRFVRYADDVIVHCKTPQESHAVLKAITQRLQACGLRLSQEKTKITYCQDYRRQKCKDYPKSFDFLGYTFKPMSKKSQRNSGVFLGFDCEMSRKARNRIVAGWRKSGFHRKSHTTLQNLAQQLNAQSRGLIRYFGVHSRWRLRSLFRHLDYRLAKWVKGKYKSITSYQKAYNYLRKIQNSYPNLFYHWSIIGLG